MLFGYPVAVTQNNWLHECVRDAVLGIHDLVDAGSPYPAWPGILPDAYRAVLASRIGLRARLSAYDDAVRGLTTALRHDVREAVVNQNRVADLVSGLCECARIQDLPASVRAPALELFGFTFDLLGELGVRDQHYMAIDAARSDHVCAFCGLEHFDAPGAPREAMDHYLTRSRYPFAAANLRNLVPMCHKCNSRYKLAIDLLRRDDGSRRVAFDPYNHGALSISLDHSEPFGGLTEYTPNWEIRFAPDTEEVPTWDEVFSVRARYRRDCLDRSFQNWLDLFRHVARRRGVHGDADEAVISVLHELEELFNRGRLQDRAFLKAAVFRMLRLHCLAGNQRLLQILRELVVAPAPS